MNVNFSANAPSHTFWGSPLKRKREENKVDEVANKALKVTFTSVTHRKLELEFQKLDIDPQIIATQPKSIVQQLEIIEEGLHQNCECPIEFNNIRTKITEILQDNWKDEKKLVELGILYYYIVSKKETSFFNNETFLEHRKLAIEKEAEKLLAIHPENSVQGAQSQLPSGCTAYLMRAFSRMIFPPDGTFNLGGCYAVLALLETRVNLYLSDEMREQVGNIVRRIIDNEEFRLLFLKPFKVHPTMEEFICLDLKIPLKIEMSFIYARWALLISLFSPFFQYESEKNCYAVAVMMKLLKDSPEVIVNLIIDALSKGTFNFREIEVPISLLMGSDRHYEPDFNVNLTANEARSSPPYLMVSAALKMPLASTTDTVEKKSLIFWMEQDFGDQINWAKKYYNSHRLSFVQQMILAILQFSAQNFTNKRMTSSLASFVRLVIAQIPLALDKKINIKLAEKDPLWKIYISNFISNVERSLFCVDYHHWDFRVEDSKVLFAHHTQGLPFSGNLNQYAPFKLLRRLFQFSSLTNSFTPLDRLSSFADFCVMQLDQQASASDPLPVKQWHSILREYLKSQEFLLRLACTVAQLNDSESQINPLDYVEADSLFLIQDGGDLIDANELPALKTKFQKKERIAGLDAGLHFRDLCHAIAKNKGQIGSHLLSDDTVHGFNIIPDLFKNHVEDPVNALQTKIIIPGTNLLYKKITFKEIKRILKITLGGKKGEEFAETHFTSPVQNYVDFATRAESLLSLKDIPKFRTALNHISLSIPFKALEEKIPALMASLNLEINQETCQEIIFELDEIAEQLFYIPAEAALLIQEVLKLIEPSIFVSKFRLEEAIRTCFDFPQVFWIANLNWTDEKAEQPNFFYLILKYDIAQRRVIYAHRWDTEEGPMPQGSSNLLLRTTFFI